MVKMFEGPPFTGEFSLILATKGRIEELERFLVFLRKQNYLQVECIIIDQNPDDRLKNICERFSQDLRILHLHSEGGLSRARNAGLRLARGEFVAFPDDDCWYPEGLINQLADLFHKNPNWDGITGTASSGEGGTSRWKWDKTSGELDRLSVWTRGISITVFLRRSVVEQVGLFDENLGLGTKTIWHSGEETDYLLRGISKGFKIHYLPNIMVLHPDKLPDYKKEKRKAFDYGAGMGYVLRKHSYPLYYSIWQCIKPVLIAIRSALLGKFDRAWYFLAVSQGRWTGLRG